MKRALLLALVASVANAEPATDVPLRGVVLGKTELSVAPIAAGEAAPGEGCWLSTEACVRQAKRIKGCEAERDALKKPQEPPSLVPVVVAFVVGLAGGAYLTWRIVK